MYGAIIGDIAGSIYEFDNIKTKDFPLFCERSCYTDDTVMTMAVAQALIKAREQNRDFKELIVQEMQDFGNRYPGRGYGCGFANWLNSKDPKPYNSFGNGSAMRVSPCGLMAVTLSEAMSLAKASAEVTHNHPEGIKGAQAVSGAIFLAKCKKSKEEIKSFIEANFYDLDKTLEEIRPAYNFNETCQGTVPQAIQAFLESDDFEDAIRNAVSLGGDSDTLAAITGSIAWTFYNEPWMLYKEPEKYEGPNVQMMETAANFLPAEFKQIAQAFSECCLTRQETYFRVGCCSSIPHADNTNIHKQLTPEPLCNGSLGRVPLKDKLEEEHHRLQDYLCGESDWESILYDLRLLVVNYLRLSDFISELSKNKRFDCLSVEECILYLTYLHRSDYWQSGLCMTLPDHKEEVRAIRRRLLEVLF